MIKYVFFVVFVIMMLLLGLFFAYFGRKILSILIVFKLKVNKKLFWILYCISIIMVFVFKSYLAAVLLYATLMFMVCDLIKLIGRFIKADKLKRLISKAYFHGITIFLVSAVIMIYAGYNAKHAVINEYDVQIDKKLEKDINIVMISDTHVGTSVGKTELDRLLDQVNSLNGDIICLCGDIFDESSSVELIAYACEIISKFDSKYGVYYVTGNHETGMEDRFMEQLTGTDVHVLSDEAVLVNDQFYIIGRKDQGHTASSGGGRDSLNQIMDKVDKSLPLILMDHKPTAFGEAREAGIDLILSGHTHDGQIFPGNLVIGLFNDLSYGYKKIDQLNAIVSSGYGTWGFPLRTGSNCELLNIKVFYKE